LTTPGFEPALLEELARGGMAARAIAAGVVVGDEPKEEEGQEEAKAIDPVFARQQLPDAAEVHGASVSALAEAAYARIEAAVDRWAGPFSLHALAPPDAPEGLPSRAALVGRETLALIAARRRRASRRYLSPEALPAAFGAETLLVQLLALTREHLLVSAAAPRPLAFGGLDLVPWPAGAAPVTIDRAPPSRAYQKLEEAFAWMGTAPAPGDACVDLGASPGGWTATLRKRGARVVAVDRAPLDPPLDRDPQVTTVLGNAFNFTPPAPVDWLVCDVVAEPQRSLAVVERWLSDALCRNLVVTIKFKGRGDYGRLAALATLFARVRPTFARVKQLAYNKNEVTVMVAGGAPPPG
jgi:23S rRNA (cytidine2498-2'-O)-methyltransferase